MLWLALSDPSIFNAIDRRLDSRAIVGISNLSGRTEIWEFAVRRGMESPWFGQGLAMWDLQTRLATGLNGAVHAHNQYLQAFSRAGFVGVITLLGLLAMIVRLVFRATPSTAGGSLALLAMFLVRSITEVPLQPNGILGGEFFAFMALLVYSIDRGLKAHRESSPRRSDTPTPSAAQPMNWRSTGLVQTERTPRS
jgi:O-antigen ligase